MAETRAAPHRSGAEIDALLARVLDDAGRVDGARLADVEGPLVEAERWEQLAALYVRAARRAEAAELARGLWLSAGLIALERAGELAEAERWLRRVLASDPDCFEALEGLAAVAARTGRPRESAALLERAVAVAPLDEMPAVGSASAEAALALGQIDRAIGVLGFVAEQAASLEVRVDALARAQEILLEAGRGPEAAAVLARRAEEQEPELGPAALLVARTLAAHPVHHDEARAWFERARAWGEPAALAGLDELAEVETNWAARADAARRRGLDARSKLEAALAYVEAAELVLRYGEDSVAAREHLARARLLAPSHPAVLDLLEALEPDPDGGLMELAGSTTDSEQRAGLHARMLRRWLGQLGAEPAPEAVSQTIARLSELHARTPEDPELALGLAELQASAGDDQGQVQTLRLFAESAPEPGLAADAYLELGRTLAERLGRTDEAMAAFEAALEKRPDEVAAAEALAALHRDAGRDRALLEVLTLSTSFVPDLESRLALVAERMELARALGDDEAAAIAGLEALGLGAEVDADGLKARCEAAGRLSSLAQAYAELARFGPAAGRVGAARTAARLRDELPGLEATREAWALVLRLAPGDDEARDALERIASESDDPGALAALLEERARTESEPEQAARHWSKLADIREHALEDRAGAAEAIERALELGGDDEAALRRAVELYRGSGAERSIELLGRLEVLVDEDERVALRLEQAELLEAHRRTEEACLHWLDLVSERPEEARSALARLLATAGGLRARVAAALEPLYVERGEDRAALEVQLVLAAEADRAEARLLAAERAGWSSLRLGAPERSVEGFVAAYAREGGAELLEVWAAWAEDRPDAASAAVQALVPYDEDVDALVARARLARAAGLDGEAEQAARGALERDPGRAEAARVLAGVLSEQGRDDDLDALLAARVASTEGPARAEAALAWARHRAERLQDAAGAAEAYRAVIELRPEDSAAWRGLATAAEAMQDVELLIEAVDALRGLEPDASGRLQARAGEGLARAERFAEALGRYESSASTGTEDALPGLDRLMAGSDSAVAAEAARIAEAIHRSHASVSGLARALEVRAEFDASPTARRDAAMELAELEAGDLGRPEAAVPRWLALWEQGELPQPAQERLLALAPSVGAVDALLDVAEGQAQSSEQWRMVGRVSLLAPRHADRARVAWTRVLDAAEGDVEALDALEQLTAAGDDPSALAEILEAKAASSAEPLERAAHLRRAASIWEDAADDSARARRAIEAALEATPEAAELWRELVRIIGPAGDPSDRAAALAEVAARTEAGVPRASAWVKVAEARREAGSEAEALEALELALATAPAHTETWHALELGLEGPEAPRAAAALEPVFRRAGDWGRLAELHRKMAVHETGGARVERWLAVLALEEERLGRAEPAREAALEALRAAPDRAELIERFVTASERAGREPVSELVEVSQGATTLEARAEVARILDARGTPEMALAAWRRVLEAGTTNPEHVRRYAALAAEGGDAMEAADALGRLAEQEETDDAIRVARWVAAGAASEVVDPEEAARRYLSALSFGPADPEALAGLRRVSEHRPERWAEALEQAIAYLDGEERGRAALELASVRLERLERPEGGLDALGWALEASEGTADAAARMLESWAAHLRERRPDLAARAAGMAEPVWQRTGAVERLVEAKQLRAELAADPEHRRSLTREIADLYERSLGQPEMAFIRSSAVFLEDPSDPDITADLARLAQATGSMEEWADLNAEAAAAVADAELRSQLFLRSATVLDRELGRGPAAVASYRAALEARPGDEAALAALERIHRSEGDAAALVQVHRAVIEHDGLDPSAVRARWLEVAELAEHELNDPSLEAEALGALRTLDPSDTSLLRRLAALGARTDQPRVSVEALRAELDLAEQADVQAGLLIQIAALERDRLDRPMAAVEAYERVLALRPGDTGAVSGLGSILRANFGGAIEARAAAALAPVHARSGAVEAQLDALERLAQHGDDEARYEALLETAKVEDEELGRPQRAFGALCRAHRVRPGTGLRARMEALARTHGLLEDLAAFYLDEADAGGGQEVLEYRHRAAAIYAQDLNDPEQAIAEYERILERVPGEARALEALEALLAGAGRFERLAEVYRRRIAQAEEPERRVALMRAFAEVQAERLGDAPGAVATLRRLHQMVPDDIGVVARLADLLDREGRVTELADALERWVGLAPDATAPRVRLARVRIRLGDLAASDRLLAQVLELEPDHAAARDLLQERFEDAVAAEEHATARSVGDMLGRALAASQAWDDLVAVLQLRAQVESRPLERVALERSIARLQDEALGRPELAFATLADAVRVAPGVEESRAELERLAERTGREVELADVYTEALASAPDPDLRARLVRRAAELLEGPDPERARAAWREVLEDRPEDAQALSALDRLDTSLGRWASLADVLERRVAFADSDAEAVPLLLRLAALWDERLGERAEAVEWYRRARARAPEHPEVLAALERLLDAEADPSVAPQLASTLERLLEVDRESASRRRRWTRLAELRAGPLNQPELAIDAWREVLDTHPTDREARVGLEEAYERTGRWPELAGLLEEGLDLVTDDREVTRLQRKLGLVRGARLGSVDEAAEVWQDILRRDPNDVEALQALRGVYRDAERWDELVGVLRKLVPLQATTAEVKVIRFELAEILFDRVGRTDDAVEAARRVLELEPHTATELMRLEELFSAAGAHAEAVRVKQSRAELAESVGEKVEILFEVAELHRDRLGRPAGAAEALEQVLSFEPDNRRAYERLAEIYRSTGDYRRLVALHDRRLDTTLDAETRFGLHAAIIDIHERRLGHPELAFSAACRALAEDGAGDEIRATAERLARETGSWDVLVEVFETQLEMLGGAPALALRRRLGAILIDELQDVAAAERHLRAVLALEPSDEEAAERLRRAFLAAGRHDDLAALLEHRLDGEEDLERRREIGFELARVHERDRSDPASALSVLQRLLERNPADAVAMEEVGRLLRVLGRWPALVRNLERRLERSEAPEARAALAFELADVLEREVGDEQGAIERYNEVLDAVGDHAGALDALERILSVSERWGELVEVYRRRIEQEPSAEGKVELLGRVAQIREQRFDDPAGAREALEAALGWWPEHLPSLLELERLRRDAKDQPGLLEVLLRHADLARSEDEAASVLLEAASLLAEAEDADGARGVLERAAATAPLRRDVAEALVAHHESVGAWPEAMGAIENVIRLLARIGASDADVASLRYRYASIQHHRLGDPEAAEASYAEALESDPNHGPALRALRELRAGEGRHADAIDLQAKEAESTEDLDEKAELLHAAAEGALEHFEDVERATVFLESAVAAQPNHVDSVRLLSDLYFSEERFSDAEALLTRLARLIGGTADGGELGRIYYRLAYTAEIAGERALALSRYHQAYEHDSTYLPTLEGLAGALLSAERWEDAQKILRAILIQHRSALTDAEVVDLHFQVGDIGMRLDELEAARRSFDRALALDRGHLPTLAAYARLEEREQRFVEAYELRSRLLGLLSDPAERFEVLIEQGRLSEKALEDPWQAVDAYAEAKRIRPDEVAVLQALVRLYRATSQVPKALEALEDLARLETEPGRRRQLFLDMARIHHEQRGDVDRAVAALNAALDVDPDFLEAFSEIERILFQARAWQKLEANYHRMLERTSKENRKARLVLWRSLAELYTKVLRNDEGARIAYEVLHRMQPDDAGVATALAAVYAQREETRPAATELYLKMLPLANDPAGPARAAFNLFYELGALDRSFCALGVLVLTGAADETELRAYQGLTQFLPPTPARPLTDALWRERVLHPHCRGALASLMSVIYRGAPQLVDQRQRAAGLKPRRERVDLSDTRANAPARLRYFDVWRRLDKVMLVPPMDAYLRPADGQRPSLLPGATPVMLAGREHGVFQTASSRAIAWTLARQMAFARPELALVAALEAQELAACLEGAIRLVVPQGSGVDLGLDPTEVAGWERLLGRHMGERARSALAQVVPEVVEERRMKKLARYLKGAEHSANRAAMLMCGDAIVAAKALDEEQAVAADVSHKSRVRELLLFVLGLEHFELREQLGAKIEPRAKAVVRPRA